MSAFSKLSMTYCSSVFVSTAGTCFIPLFHLFLLVDIRKFELLLPEEEVTACSTCFTVCFGAHEITDKKRRKTTHSLKFIL
jgi:hypothetical protein